MITVDDIKAYKSLKDKISKLVENYYQKEIYCHYMYELCDWYIKEDTNDIVINYSYIDYHNLHFFKIHCHLFTIFHI